MHVMDSSCHTVVNALIGAQKIIRVALGRTLPYSGQPAEFFDEFFQCNW